MKCKKVFPYNLRKIVPMALLAVLPFAGCEKDPTPEQQSPKIKQVVWGYNPEVGSLGSHAAMLDSVRKYVADPSYDSVDLHLMDDNDLRGFTCAVFRSARDNLCAPAIEMGPVGLSGNWNCTPGAMAKEDSIWYVEHGMGVNGVYAKQR